MGGSQWCRRREALQNGPVQGDMKHWGIIQKTTHAKEKSRQSVECTE